MENWQDYYYVKENGEIWRKVGKRCRVERLLKPRNSGKGYLYIAICGEGFIKKMYIHRLVALTYIPNPDNLPFIDHIDRNKLNNNIENLRWVTRSQNAVNILWKPGKSGEKYISIKKNGTYHISFNRNKIKYRRHLPKTVTIEEAVVVRDKMLSDNGFNLDF